MASNREIIEFSIHMDAVNALRAVNNLTKNATDMQRVWDELTIAAKNFSDKTGLSLNRVGDLFGGIIRQGEQLRRTLDAAGLNINKLPNDLRKIAGIDLFTGKDIKSKTLEGVGVEAGIGINAGIKQLRENLREAQVGMEQTDKAAADLSKNLSNAAAQAQLLSVYTKQGFQNLSFAPLKTQADTLAQYKSNVQSLMTGISAVSKETKTNISDVGKIIEQNFQNIPKVAITDAIKGLNNETKGLKKNFEDAGTAAKGFNQILHLIRGTLVAIGVFQIISFITDSFYKATEAAKEFETSLYRIQNVEKILSQSGIETSVAGLKEVIQDVKKEFPIFSEADITQQISLIGIMTKEFALTEDQIGEVAKAIGVLNIRSAGMEDLLTTTNKVLTAMVAPAGRGIASLGLDFSEAAIKAMALKNGILDVGEAFTNLTDHDKDMLKIAILLESTGEELKTVQQFLETNTGALANQEAEWEDTLKTAGQYFITLKASLAPILIAIMKMLQGAINLTKAFFVPWFGFLALLESIGKAIFVFIVDPLQSLKNFDNIIADIAGSFKEGMQKGFQNLFSGVIPTDAPKWFTTLFGGLVDDADTATGALKNFAEEGLGSVENALDKANMDDFLDDMEELNEKLEELNREFNEKLSRMEQDFNTERSRDLEDYNNQVADTIQDFNDKRHDAEQKYRLQEAEAEAKFQETLRQLREKFLFGLEDALRERDARQVLRLIREYNMEKENLTNEERLRKEFAAKQHAEEMARLRREEAERLAELEREFQIKQQRAQQDYETKKAREIEEHQQDLEDLRDQIADRLEEFSEEIAKELGLREGGAEMIYEALSNYYGPGGLFDAMYAYSIGSASTRAQELLNIISNLMTQVQTSLSGLGSSINIKGGKMDIGGQASGGIYYADKPTTATFGEAGPEMAAFLPIKNAKQGMKLASGLTGGGGMGGNLSMRIMLSHGLVAEIVDQSLENVSTIIEEVQRNR